MKETVELVGPGAVGTVVHKRNPSGSSSSLPSPVADRRVSVDGEGERAGIRQRLAAVMGSSSYL